jgi:hypothetical protein
LLNAPILFGMKWTGKRPGKRVGRWLRLSFGLSLSVGQPVSKRFVCFLEHAKSVPHVALGGQLKVEQKEGSTLIALPAWANRDLPSLAQAVVVACETYRDLPEVKTAVLKIGRERRTELTYLEQLYRRKQGTNDRLYGRPASGAGGSNAIEAEFRALQNIVVQRYAVQIRAQMLTLGILEGEVPQTVIQ